MRGGARPGALPAIEGVDGDAGLAGSGTAEMAVRRLGFAKGGRPREGLEIGHRDRHVLPPQCLQRLEAEDNGAVARGDVDLAIMGHPPREADVVADPFTGHPSIIICAPAHPLAGVFGLRLEDLAAEDFISREPGAGTRAMMEGFFASRNFSPRVVMTSSSNEMIKQAVMTGMGIALISRHTISLELGLGLLRELLIEDMPLMRSWYVVHRRSLPLLPVHAQLRKYLLDHGQKIIDELDERHRRIGGSGRKGIRAGMAGPAE